MSHSTVVITAVLFALCWLKQTNQKPLSPSTQPYKPVVLVHGIMSNATNLNMMTDYISTAHPGTVVYDTNYFTNMLSLTDLWTQVKVIGEFVQNVSDAHPEGFHIMGYSQGGVVVRGILQTMPNLNVHNFIALSSPMNGQYGEDEMQWFPGWAKQDLHIVLYTALGQRLSVGNYWRDPHHLDDYRQKNVYLPVLNNESTFIHPDAEQYKENFLRVQKLVLVGGMNDGVITPYESAFFGSYDENEQVVPVEDTILYQGDYFGLRTFRERGSLFVHNISDVEHHMWPKNTTVLDTLLPYLD